MRYEYNLGQPVFTADRIDILNVSREKGYRHSYRNGRAKHGFIYTVSGVMRDSFTESGESVRVSAGELIFIPKSCAYIGTYLEEHTENRIVQFDIAAGTLPDYLLQPKIIDIPNAGQAIDDFFRPMTPSRSCQTFYYLSCLYRLLWQIDDFFARIPAKYNRLQPALSEMAERFDLNRTVDDYAALCDMSEVNFRRLFREYTGKSPIDYRNDIRLRHAQSLLRSGEYNVSEAAESAGFSNLSFFIRLYKKKFGHTPKQE